MPQSASAASGIVTQSTAQHCKLVAETGEKKEYANISLLTDTKMISGKNSHNGFSDVHDC